MTDRKLVATLPDITRRVIEDPKTGEKREYYLGSLKSSLARALTFVPVKEASKKTYLQERLDDGYQRPGSATRMRAFGKYLQENPLSVVPPIVVSGREDWLFQGKGNVGELRLYGPAAIVDGQHRMGGYVYLNDEFNEERTVDFVLLSGLAHQDEIDEFLAINNTQKGVPKSLNVLLDESDDSVVAVGLNERDESPLKGRIAQIQRTKDHLFTHAAAAKNIGRTFHHGAFEDVDIETKLDIAIEYWTQIADAFPIEWEDIDRRPQETKLLETTGLIAWSLCGPDILGPAFDPQTSTTNWDQVKKRISVLAIPGALDWAKDGEFQGLTGEVGGAKIHKKMQSLLSAGAPQAS